MGEFDDLITELCGRHVRFPRKTISRLVSRTADTCARTSPDEPPESLLSQVREAVEEQLSYLDEDLPLPTREPARQSLARPPRLPYPR